MSTPNEAPSMDPLAITLQDTLPPPPPTTTAVPSSVLQPPLTFTLTDLKTTTPPPLVKINDPNVPEQQQQFVLQNNQICDAQVVHIKQDNFEGPIFILNLPNNGMELSQEMLNSLGFFTPDNFIIQENGVLQSSDPLQPPPLTPKLDLQFILQTDPQPSSSTQNGSDLPQNETHLLNGLDLLTNGAVLPQTEPQTEPSILENGLEPPQTDPPPPPPPVVKPPRKTKKSTPKNSQPSTSNQEPKDNRHNQIFTCTTCNANFKNFAVLATHIDATHSFAFQCICGDQIHNLRKYYEHLQVKHQNKNAWMSIRHTLVKNKYMIESKATTKVDYPLHCPLCGVQCASLASLFSHISHIHPTLCTVCGILFDPTPGKLPIEHEYLHQTGSIQYFQCTKCLLQFRTQQAIKLHSTMHYYGNKATGLMDPIYRKIPKIETQNYTENKCPLCYFVFKPEKMGEHLQIHEFVRCKYCSNPFVVIKNDPTVTDMCSICSNSVQMEDESGETGERKIIAKKKYTKKKPAPETTTVTSPPPPPAPAPQPPPPQPPPDIDPQQLAIPCQLAPENSYPCIFCNVYIQEQMALVRHLNQAHQICQICMLEFSSVTDFHAHMLLHKEKKISVHSCSYCKSRFQSQELFTGHKEIYHPNVSVTSSVINRVPYYKLSNNDELVQCVYCNAEFGENVREEHYRLAHGVKVCTECNAKYIMGSNVICKCLLQGQVVFDYIPQVENGEEIGEDSEYVVKKRADDSYMVMCVKKQKV